MTKPLVLITSRYPDDLIAEFERHAAVRRECGRGAESPSGNGGKSVGTQVPRASNTSDQMDNRNRDIGADAVRRGGVAP
jgi:hypothetical protein